MTTMEQAVKIYD